MAGRGKVSLYMIFFIMAFGTIGLISFQTLKERKNSTTLLVAKYKEIDSLNNQYEELLDATKKSLLQAKVEKENLIRRIKDLENNSHIHHNTCNKDKEKYKLKKEMEITNLKQILQAKDIELINTSAKVEALKLDNKKIDTKILIKNVGKDNLFEEGLEPFVENLDIKDKKSKISLLERTAKGAEKISDAKSIMEESNIVKEAKVEETNGDVDFEDDKYNRANQEENELTASKLVEEDDAKELEVDMKLSDFDGGETNDSQIQE